MRTLEIGVFINELCANGVRSFVWHLVQGLKDNGITVHLLKLHNGKTSPILRSYGRGDVYYQNVSVEHMERVARTMPTIMATTFHGAEDAANRLIACGTRTMVHSIAARDTTLVCASPIVVRESMLDRVHGSVFLPHPYKRQIQNAPKKYLHAISSSRLDVKKGTLTVLDAIFAGAHIDLYGELMPFLGMNLDKKYPGWRDRWKGKFKALTGVELVSPYKYMVDMTAIKGDGGGTQYIIFEAWDAGTIPVLHESWVTPGSVFNPGVNCITVADYRGLLNLKAKLSPTGFLPVLHAHDAKNIAKKFIKELQR